MARNTPLGGAKRLANCLPDRLRGALSAHVDENFRLQQAWHACVAEPLASHARPVRYATGLLFIHVNTPAWASRLRHEKPALLTQLRENPAFRDIGDIRFRVVPIESAVTDARALPQPSRLSTQAAKVVAQTAATIADPPLRAALERLAQSTPDLQDSKRRR
jgi:hypothetical protein